MEYRILGRTGLKVSEIGFGLSPMSNWTGSADSQSYAALQRSLELGCNFFDTAWDYGRGHSDKLLGQLIKDNPGKEIIVADKIPPKNLKWPATPEYSLNEVFPRDHVMEYTERILELLAIPAVDVMQFHVWDDSWTEDEQWQRVVADLKSQRLIKWFGLSLNRWEPWNGIRAIKTGLVDVVQVIYNIFDQSPEDELFPLCAEMDVGVIARVPLDEGGLSGTLTRETRYPDKDWRSRYFGPENLAPTVERAEALKKITPPGMDLAEMALRFILTNKSVSTTIVGMRTLEHVEQNISYSDGRGRISWVIGRIEKPPLGPGGDALVGSA